MRWLHSPSPSFTPVHGGPIAAKRLARSATVSSSTSCDMDTLCVSEVVKPEAGAGREPKSGESDADRSDADVDASVVDPGSCVYFLCVLVRCY